MKVPEILVYNGPSIRRRIDEGGEVTVDYLTERLTVYLSEFVQRPPYHLVGSSLGGQIVLTYAACHPESVRKLVLICPSGLHGDEHLPVIDGVRRSHYDTIVRSVFHRPRFADAGPRRCGRARNFENRSWKKAVLRTLRGTVGHTVASLLDHVTTPTLIIWGDRDNVLSDVAGSIRAAARLPNVKQVVIPRCGHAPQIEKAGLVNTLVTRFLRDTLKAIPPALDVDRYLERVEREGSRAQLAQVAQPQRT